MANKDRAEKWLSIVAEDLSVAEDLYKTGHWLYVGFMCHQVVEKTLKCYWCVCRDDDPPYIHDHKKIAQGCGLYTKICHDIDKVSLYIEPILLESGEDSPIYREVMRTGVAV